MRKFTITEQELISRLLLIAQESPLRLDKLLARVYFSEAYGRALILQPTGNYGCLYLRPEKFADTNLREAELKALGELMMLLAWLRREGYVMVQDPPSPLEAAMHFVGDIFGDIRPSLKYLVLNSRGDYSADPQTIQDRDGRVIYESVRFDGDLFDLAMRMSGGLAQVSPTIEDLLRPQPMVATAFFTPQAPVAGATRTVVVPMHKADYETGAEAPPTKNLENLNARKEEKRKLARAISWLRLHAGTGGFFVLVLVLGVLVGRHATSLEELLLSALGNGAATPTTGTAEPVSSTNLSPSRLAVSTPMTQSLADTQSNSAADIYEGLDLSKWNGNWLEHLQGPLKAIRFAFARASYGRAKDPSFGRHWAALAKNGIVRGSYHFYLVHDDPIEQARHYLSVVGRLTPQDIAPAVDFEELSFPPASAHVPLPDRTKIQADLLAFLEFVQRETGRTPLIYTDVATGNRWLDDSRFARFPLWIAYWEKGDAPKLPAAWKNKGFRFWQRTANYSLPEAGRQSLDLDLFRGRLEDLPR